MDDQDPNPTKRTMGPPPRPSVTPGPPRAASIREQAQAELEEEQAKSAKKKMVGKLRELNHARTVVANIEREIDDLEEAIAQGNV